MIVIYMSNNNRIELPHIEVKEWSKVVNKAMKRNAFINAYDPDDGHKTGINPDHIVYWTCTP